MFPFRKLIPLLLCVYLAAGCSVIGTAIAPTKDSSTAALIPNLASYIRTNTTDIKGAVASVIGGAGVVTGNLEITAFIAAANRLSTCYNNAGAYEASIYINKGDPTKSGFILVINNNAIKDMAILASCLSTTAGSSVASVQPCTNSYTLPAGSNSYNVFYAATDPSVCNDFCNALTGCVRH